MESYNERDELLDGLVEIIESFPQPTVRIINPYRYRVMLHAIQNLGELLTSNYMEGDIQSHEAISKLLQAKNKIGPLGVATGMDAIYALDSPRTTATI